VIVSKQSSHENVCVQCTKCHEALRDLIVKRHMRIMTSRRLSRSGNVTRMELAMKTATWKTLK
jgi:hypothetical protein